MRTSFRSASFLAGLIFAGSFVAHADLITFTASQEATGTLGSQSFTNKLVTISASLTTEDLAACQDFSSPNYCAENTGHLLIDETAGLSAPTIKVEGLGVFGTQTIYALALVYSGSFADAENIESFTIGDVEGRLFLPTDNATLEGCLGLEPEVSCPFIAETSGGDLVLTSVSGSSEEFQVTSDTPEPATFTLLATGLLGATAMLRRRILQH